jgi:tetratricopeptide (TPR) repeat protein
MRSLFATFHRIVFAAICCVSLMSGGWAQQNEKAAPQADPPQEHFHSAQTFQIAGDYEKAAAEYRAAIARGLQQLGNLRVSHKEFSPGTDLLTRAVQIEPSAVAARIDLGIARFKAGDFEAAKAEIEAALRQDPQDVRALNLAGKIYFMQGNFQAAADSLQAALQLQPDFDIGYTLALADLELKKTTPAGIIFDEMLASSKPSASLQALIGIAYRETGYLDQAVSHLNKALALDPKDSRARASLGLTYFLQGPQSYGRAREQFVAALAITAADYTSLYHLGMIAANQHNLPEAIKWFRRAAAARPSEPDIYFRLAQAQFDSGEFQLAVATLRKSENLFSRDPKNPDVALVHELLGHALEKQGKHSDAAAELARAQEIRSAQPKAGSGQPTGLQSAWTDHPGQQEVRSMVLEVPRGSLVSKADEAEYVRQISALLGEAYDNLGVIDARAGRYADASAEFSQAAHWNSGIQGLDRNWGTAAFRANQFDQAISPLERQLRRTPGDPVVREMLGVCYFMSDKFGQAASVFTPALDKLSDNPGVLYAAGVSLVRSGNTKAAAKLFSRMLKDHPNVPQVHLLLGQAHAELAEYPEALAEFSRALELDPKLAEAHYYKGIVRFKQGQMDDAGQEFQAELVVNPKMAAAQYQLAVVRLAQHQLDDSVRLLTQVLAETPGNADAHYQLGKALLEKDNVKGAVENFEAAARLQPRDYTYYQLSLAYRRDGRLPDAKNALAMYERLKRKPASPSKLPQ